MSLKDQIASDATAVFLNEDDFAETVRLRTAAGAWKPVSAVVDLDEANREYIEGDKVVIRGSLHISSAITGFAKDVKVKVRDEIFTVTSVDLPEGGLRLVSISRTASTRSNSSRLDPLV